MLGLEIRLLMERYAAATVSDASEPEWPPHPARVFSALTAALHDDAEPAAASTAALEWMQTLKPPAILASDVSPRRLGPVYVPVNDQTVLADVSPAIAKVEAAEENARQATGKAAAAAGKALRKARDGLVRKSAASAEWKGSGNEKLAAEVANRRLKPQPRFFPAVIPDSPVVTLLWEETATDERLRELDALAERIARLGHSSSLVSMRFLREVTSENPSDGRIRWTPASDGSHQLRVPVPDQLRRLEEAHARHQQVEARVLPAKHVRYGQETKESHRYPAPEGFFSSRAEDWIVFEAVASPVGEPRARLDVSLAQQAARALRGTLFRELEGRLLLAEALTGHAADGSPSTRPHLAYVPLPDVRSAMPERTSHATGTILGIALVPPADLDPPSRLELLALVHRAEVAAAEDRREAADMLDPSALRLTLGRHGELYLRRVRMEASLRTLRPRRWCAESRRWASATSVALGRNPGNLQSRDPEEVRKAVENAEAIVAMECRNAGYPEPSAVWIHRRPLVEGSRAARRFMPFPSQGVGHRRVCVHVELLFDAPVRGPVLIGAGRYYGIGLCAPLGRA